MGDRRGEAGNATGHGPPGWQQITLQTGREISIVISDRCCYVNAEGAAFYCAAGRGQVIRRRDGSSGKYEGKGIFRRLLSWQPERHLFYVQQVIGRFPSGVPACDKTVSTEPESFQFSFSYAVRAIRDSATYRRNKKTIEIVRLTR